MDNVLLDESLRRIAAKSRPRKLKYWVRALGGPRKQLPSRLVERGVLAERPHRILWLFPSPRHELVVHEALDETVAPLRAFLMGRPQSLTPELTVPGPYLRDARQRAKAIAKGDAGGQAVSEIVSESQAAVMAVITANTGFSSVLHR